MLQEVKKYQLALSYLHTALQGTEQLLGPDHLTVAPVYAHTHTQSHTRTHAHNSAHTQAYAQCHTKTQREHARAPNWISAIFHSPCAFSVSLSLCIPCSYHSIALCQGRLENYKEALHYEKRNYTLLRQHFKETVLSQLPSVSLPVSVSP